MNDDEIINLCNNDYTMLSCARRKQLLDSVNHIIKNNIDGDIIEIGVWRGGAIMLILYKLLQLGITDRHVHLYDTFNGMTEASIEDVCIDGRNATDKDVFDSVRCENSFEVVYQNVKNTGYPMKFVHFHIGDIRNVKIEDIPDKISLLRLDNDWYELYKFELPIFEPRVTNNGIVIIDDYNWWNGCKKAVDDYISEKNYKTFLSEETLWWYKK